MGVAVLERYVDDYQVVDVIEIISEALSSDVWVNIANDEVTGGSNTYLVCDVTRKDELPVIPSELNLELPVSNCRDHAQLVNVLSCRGCRCRSAWHSS